MVYHSPPTLILKAEPYTRVHIQNRAGETVVRKTYIQPRLLLWRTLFTPSRACREYQNLLAVCEAGLPCVEPLAWSEERRSGVVHRSTLWTRYLAEAPSLKACLQEGSFPRGVERNATLRRTGELLAGLHEAGILSCRFTPRNLLVQAGGDPGRPVVSLCDQPAAVLHGRSLLGRRTSWIDLHDIAFKESRVGELRRTERFRILEGYFGPDRRALGRVWRRLHRRPDFLNRFLKFLVVVRGSYLRAWIDFFRPPLGFPRVPGRLVPPRG